jgi:phosphomannomutase
MDGRGQFVDPHRILALALQYLVEHRGWRGKVIKTVSTTQMLNRLAAKYGLEVVETPVGFNHIAEYMRRGEALLGGEESGGMSFQGHIPEGDGILMGLLLVEIVAVLGAPLEQQVEALLAKAGPSHYERVDLRLSAPVAKARLVERLQHEAPQSIGGVRVVRINPLDGVKYLLDDESWLLIRPSGTEPVLRVYAEARELKMVQALVAHGKAVAEGRTI